MIEPVPLGATFTGTGTVFNVWAPLVENVKLHVLTPKSKYFDMKRVEGGYWQVEVPGTGPGTDYKYLIDGREEYPDPASRYQPGGVHGPSSVVSNRYDWRDEAWKGIPSD